MITTEQLKTALANYGLNVSDDILDCYVEIVNEKETCLTASGVTECQIKIILLNTALLLCWSAGTYQIESTRGATGASVTFKYDADIYSKLVNQIGLFDKGGCMTDIIPASPGFNLFDVCDGVL